MRVWITPVPKRLWRSGKSLSRLPAGGSKVLDRAKNAIRRDVRKLEESAVTSWITLKESK